MKETPMIFNGEMVRAILEGRKTQTRRMVVFRPTGEARPIGFIGDRIWVRETFGESTDFLGNEVIGYRADSTAQFMRNATFGNLDDNQPIDKWKWRPSIHMPRWACRIVLEIVSIRVERLQNISPSDCKAEGLPEANNEIGLRYCFGQLWNSIYKNWDDNPWVWVIEFRRIK